MIDLHSHIIPSIDDGCHDINEAFEIMQKANKFGINKMFATSHYIDGKYDNTRDKIIIRVDYLNSYLKAKKVDFEVVIGSEVMIYPNIVQDLKSRKLCTLNDSRYVLIELPMDIKVPNITKVINDILVIGYVPIIAHPERYSYIQKDIKEAISFVEAGALLQLNIGSLTEKNDKEISQTAKELLKNNLIHLWGSDSHIFRCIYDKKFDKVLDELKKIVGEEKYKQITEINPENIYNNKEIEIFEIN